MSLRALAEFGKCLIPLNAHFAFLAFSCLLGLIHLLSFPEHSATSPRTCWCAWDAAHRGQFQLIKLHQARLLPGTWELYFSHLASFLGALLPQQMAFLSCFWKVHMAYKREYLFNCKT